jgi:hypothetical protein
LNHNKVWIDASNAVSIDIVKKITKFGYFLAKSSFSMVEESRRAWYSFADSVGVGLIATNTNFAFFQSQIEINALTRDVNTFKSVLVLPRGAVKNNKRASSICFELIQIANAIYAFSS